MICVPQISHSVQAVRSDLVGEIITLIEEIHCLYRYGVVLVEEIDILSAGSSFDSNSLFRGLKSFWSAKSLVFDVVS